MVVPVSLEQAVEHRGTASARRVPLAAWTCDVAIVYLDTHVQPRQTIEAFDRYLVGLGLRFEAEVIGGAALNLLGVVDRLTRDCDVLEPTVR